MLHSLWRVLLKWLLLHLVLVFDRFRRFCNGELALEHLENSNIVVGSPEKKDSEAPAFRNCLK
jgi:hypothetical protein